MASGYERQVRPGGGGYDLALADADTFGGALGRGIQQTGQMLEQREDLAGRRELESAQLDYGVKAAEFRARRTQALADAKLNAGPGAAGHADAVLKDFDRDRDTLLEGVSNRRVRERAMVDLAEQRGGIEADAHVFEAGQRVAKGFTDLDQQARIGANRVTIDPSPKSWGEEMDALHVSVSGMSGPDDAKGKFLRGKEGELTVAFLQALPAPQRKALIEGGTVSQYLDPNQLTALREGADVDIRNDGARAQHQANQARGVEREAIQTEEVLLNAGEGSPAQWRSIAARKRALGDTSGAAAADVRAAETVATAGMRGMPVPAIDSRLAEIEAIAARGAGLSAAQGIEKRGLERERKAMAALPPLLAQQRATGQDVPPLEWTAAGISGRAQLARVAARVQGKPYQPLLADEAGALSADIHGGLNQRMAAAQRIGMWGAEREAVLAQIPGVDGVFRMAVRLGRLPDGGAAQRDAMKGPDALRANPELLKPLAGEDGPQTVIAGLAGYALRRLDRTYVADLTQTAQAVYAARMANDGRTEYDAGRLRGGLESSLGGIVDRGEKRGGLGEWRGKPMLLPTGMTQAETETALSQSSGAAMVMAAGGLKPMAVDGKAVSVGMLRTFEPVAVGDGLYEFETGRGVLRSSDGRTPFRVNIRKLR